LIHHIEKLPVRAECRDRARSGPCSVWAAGQGRERTARRVDRKSRDLIVARAREIKMRALRVDRDVRVSRSSGEARIERAAGHWRERTRSLVDRERVDL